MAGSGMPPKRGESSATLGSCVASREFRRAGLVASRDPDVHRGLLNCLRGLASPYAVLSGCQVLRAGRGAAETRSDLDSSRASGSFSAVLARLWCWSHAIRPRGPGGLRHVGPEVSPATCGSVPSKGADLRGYVFQGLSRASLFMPLKLPTDSPGGRQTPQPLPTRATGGRGCSADANPSRPPRGRRARRGCSETDCL